MHLWQKSLVLNREILESREKNLGEPSLLSKHVCLCSYFWLVESLCARHFSSEQGLLSAAVQASHCGGFSCCGAQPLGFRGVSSCGPQA